MKYEKEIKKIIEFYKDDLEIREKIISIESIDNVLNKWKIK